MRYYVRYSSDYIARDDLSLISLVIILNVCLKVIYYNLSGLKNIVEGLVSRLEFSITTVIGVQFTYTVENENGEMVNIFVLWHWHAERQ